MTHVAMAAGWVVTVGCGHCIRSRRRPSKPARSIRRLRSTIKEEIPKLSNLPTMPGAHSQLLVLLGKTDEEIDLNLVSSTLA